MWMVILHFFRPIGRLIMAKRVVIDGNNLDIESVLRVARLDDDRPLHPDINAMIELVREGSIVKGVERAAGPIHLGDFPY